MQIQQLSHASGPLWQSAMAIYQDVFPQWERESEQDIAQAVNAGRSRAIVICQGDQVLGMSLTEMYPQLSFAMLGYLFIAPSHQGQGLGKRLCDELFDFFDPHPEFTWLLVEAESGPEQFYKRLGFTTFDFEYLSPHYDDEHATPMALMYHTKPNAALPNAEQLCQIVAHIFNHSYYLSMEDPRLKQQLETIRSKDEV
ncbi:GNAT family N-acetyltransferase [Shewanella maritima]|uniref:GNAT family N-acetyltransferase n=1 Tax=Shewanella maritima TaxID=2520507 RepID=UPI0037370914